MLVREFAVNVEASFEVGESLVEAPSLHAGFDSRQCVVLLLDFSNDCLPICFEFDLPFVVAIVAFDFSVGCGVVEGMGHLSQGMIMSPLCLE